METKRNFYQNASAYYRFCHPAMSQISIAAILFVIACKELKIAQITPGQLLAKSGNFQTNFS